jgi:hypothetical protein
LYLSLTGALAAGLAAAYMPLLAIMATAATDAFQMAPSIAAFTTAMLSLGGYDIICLIERRWKNRLRAAAPIEAAPAAAEGESR